MRRRGTRQNIRMKTRKGNERNENRGGTGRETLFLSSEGLASFGGGLSSSGASVVIWSENVGTGFSRVACMEFFDEFVGVREIRSGGPLEFFVGTFVTDPLYIIEQFACCPTAKVVL